MLQVRTRCGRSGFVVGTLRVPTCRESPHTESAGHNGFVLFVVRNRG